MKATKQNRIGTIVWNELQSTHKEDIKNIWADMLGYEWQSHALHGKINYDIASHNDKNSYGLVDLPKAVKNVGGGSFHLYSFAVESLEESKKKAISLGAKVIVEEISLEAIGRWAILTDPLGAVFSLMEIKAEPAPLGSGETGDFWWHELICKNPAKSAFFYSKLFHWKMQEIKLTETETHYIAESANGELVRISFRPMAPALKEAAILDFWLGFICVDDMDEACTKALHHGAAIISEETGDVEGRYTWLSLPDKSIIGLIEP